MRPGNAAAALGSAAFPESVVPVRVHEARRAWCSTGAPPLTLRCVWDLLGVLSSGCGDAENHQDAAPWTVPPVCVHHQIVDCSWLGLLRICPFLLFFNTFLVWATLFKITIILKFQRGGRQGEGSEEGDLA